MHDPDPFVAKVPGIDYGILDSLLGYAVRRAQIRLYEDFIPSLAPWGITPPRFSAMVIVSRNPGLKLTQLARIMGIARSGSVSLVDAIEALGYIQRLPMPGDRRAFGLALTAKGEADLIAISAAVQAHDARMAQALTPEEHTVLRGLLARLSEAQP
ncbi:MarR family winged helix-turn-helix transcriptional regulator [Aquabacterium sp.]|jgi:DNA-binding MarR family transcriptional regulator|uniref:MarR family winged helix-turn-helix transcriptional regulator n=1 Tax=Aquabacterium sp. TaxID=1872578 RepID=UPI0025C08E77|nr:MarR family winged helix-turn-helix transcriptional regulator [Aquabacterium sp.]